VCRSGCVGRARSDVMARQGMVSKVGRLPAFGTAWLCSSKELSICGILVNAQPSMAWYRRRRVDMLPNILLVCCRHKVWVLAMWF
jgi:hypothetical protein